MSTKKIREALEWARHKSEMAGTGDAWLAEALAEVEAIERSAVALVDWNNKGRPAFHLDAARGYDVLERIAKESGK